MAFQDDIKDVVTKYGSSIILSKTFSNILKDVSREYRDDANLQSLVKQFLNDGYAAKLLSYGKLDRRSRESKTERLAKDFSVHVKIKHNQAQLIIQYFRYAVGWDLCFSDRPKPVDYSYGWHDFIESMRRWFDNKFVFGAIFSLLALIVLCVIVRDYRSVKFEAELQECSTEQKLSSDPDAVLLKVKQLQTQYCGIWAKKSSEYLSTAIFEKAVSAKCRKLAAQYNHKIVVDWIDSYMKTSNLTVDDYAILRDYRLIYKNY